MADPRLRSPSNPSPVRVLIADDHAVVRYGLRALIGSQRGWTVCGEAKTGLETVSLAKRFAPDVVILDVTMPRLSGLDAARRLRRLPRPPRIVFLTMHESERMLDEAISAGASGYLVKSDAGSHLVRAVRAALRGELYVSAGMAGRSAGGEADELAEPPLGTLTSREREVLQLVAEGRSTKEIAEAMEISVKTVDAHRTNLMRKLDLHSAVDLTRYAVRNQIVQG